MARVRSGYNPPDNVVATAELRRPIRIFGDDVTTLRFRMAEFGDVAGIRLAKLDEDLDGETLALLTHRLANVPLPSAKRIPLADAAAVGEAIGIALDPFGDSPSPSEATD
jgi:hypothetical protein